MGLQTSQGDARGPLGFPMHPDPALLNVAGNPVPDETTLSSGFKNQAVISGQAADSILPDLANRAKS